MSVEDPFERLGLSLSPTPWLLKPGSWERVVSYAWLIYLHASKYGGAQGPAHEWACAFKRAFTRTYVNDVLPLFKKQYELVDQVVDRLSIAHRGIEGIMEGHGHNSAAAIIEELVKSRQPGVISPL